MAHTLFLTETTKADNIHISSARSCRKWGTKKHIDNCKSSYLLVIYIVRQHCTSAAEIPVNPQKDKPGQRSAMLMFGFFVYQSWYISWTINPQYQYNKQTTTPTIRSHETDNRKHGEQNKKGNMLLFRIKLYNVLHQQNTSTGRY